MNNMKFFIDTADTTYIKYIWDSFLSNGIQRNAILGITTNPNAMTKCNITTMTDFKQRTRNLCELISLIRNDDKGVVYVQHPSSNITTEDLHKWIEIILNCSDGQTKIGIKIPPYIHLLKLIKDYGNVIDFNVTGISDCSTALLCFTYSPRYVSLIPGRMEEQGINAIEQMRYIDQRNNKYLSELITGSMRTIEGLKSAIYCNTIPTIGTKVFDLLSSGSTSDFINLWNYNTSSDTINFSPHIDQRMTDLSVSFFKQMDQMGISLYKDLYE